VHFSPLSLLTKYSGIDLSTPEEFQEEIFPATCTMYNEHVVRLVKGSHQQYGGKVDRESSTESCSISEFTVLCKQFDSESNVPVTTSAHSTRTDNADVQK
jgi:hypothetical protein